MSNLEDTHNFIETELVHLQFSETVDLKDSATGYLVKRVWHQITFCFVGPVEGLGFCHSEHYKGTVRMEVPGQKRSLAGESTVLHADKDGCQSRFTDYTPLYAEMRGKRAWCLGSDTGLSADVPNSRYRRLSASPLPLGIFPDCQNPAVTLRWLSCWPPASCPPNSPSGLLPRSHLPVVPWPRSPRPRTPRPWNGLTSPPRHAPAAWRARAAAVVLNANVDVSSATRRIQSVCDVDGVAQSACRLPGSTNGRSSSRGCCTAIAM